MLEASASDIMRRVPDGALVLDVGGWGSPFPRADWVLDVMPYESRGLYDYDTDRAAERFSEDTWVIHDICSRTPWPFSDDQFDFVVCSHTLEDIRDPIWVCHELQRVARAGYIETPSRLEEQTWGVHGPWVGWSHHRWLVDEEQSVLRFAMKPALLHDGDHFPAGHLERLSAEDRVLRYWWEGSFEVEEVWFSDPQDLHDYLREVGDPSALVRAGSDPRGRGAHEGTSLRERVAHLVLGKRPR